MQIAGKTCILCDHPIGGIRDGLFCPRCGSPIHAACVQKPPGQFPAECCQGCGCFLEVLIQANKTERRDRIRREAGLYRQEFLGGALISLFGLLLLIGSVVMSGGVLIFAPTGVIVFGLSLMARSVIKRYGK